jgi:multisubunit Na+/H+ antiporter MnhC subunit
MEYLSMAAGFLLVLTGLWGIATRKHLIRIIIGFTILNTGIHVIIVSIGYLKGKTAPILDTAVNLKHAALKIVDPVPQALVLTAIVIGLGVTSLMLIFAIKLYEKKKTLIISNFEDLKW